MDSLSHSVALEPEQRTAVERDAFAVLLGRKDEFADRLRQALDQATVRKELPHPVDMLLVDLRLKATDLLSLRNLPEATDPPDPDVELLRDYHARLMRELLKLAGDYGLPLSEASRRQFAFVHGADAAPADAQENADASPTYAAFREAHAAVRAQLQSRRRLARMPAIFQRAAAGKGRSELHEAETGFHALWQSPEVRMAHARDRHMSFIRDIGRKRLISLSDSSIELLEEIDRHVYGASDPMVKGVFLSGEPGEGKSSVLIEYFRLNGIEPVVITSDPGQTAFTLFSRPTLGNERAVEGRRDIMQVIRNLTAEELRAFFRDQPSIPAQLGIADIRLEGEQAEADRLRAIAALLGPVERAYHLHLARAVTGDEQAGRSMGPILEAAQEEPGGRPVVVDEAPELRDSASFNTLLTVRPATDAEAGPKPTWIPTEGRNTQMPVGWYFDTQMRWIRVREKFRICMAGNLGARFGNSGASLPWIDRFGRGFLSLPLSRSRINRDQEDVESIVWPRLCDPETGKFLLTAPGQAYRLHFFVTEFLPRIRRWMQQQYNGVALPLTRRLLIRIAESLHEQHERRDELVEDHAARGAGTETLKRRGVNFDEAIMESLIRPSNSYGLRESLPYLIAMLQAGGYLGSRAHQEEINDRILPGHGNDVAELTASAQRDRDGVPKYEYNAYTGDDEHFDGACQVCGVVRCPCHGRETKEYVQFSEHAARLAAVGVDRTYAERLRAWQRSLVEGNHWNLFLESYVGDRESASIAFPRDAVTAYAAGLAQSVQAEPEHAPGTMDLLLGARERALLTDTHLTPEWRDAVRGHWRGRLLAAVAEIATLAAGPARGRGSRVRPRQIQQQMDMHVDPAIAAYRGLCRLYPDFQLDDEERAAFVAIAPRAGVTMLARLRDLRCEGNDLTNAVRHRVRTKRNDLRAELDAVRAAMFPAQAEGGAPPDPYLAYGEVVRALDLASDLSALEIAQPTDADEIAGYAQTLLAHSSTQPPAEAMMSSLRVLRSLARVRNVGIEQSLEYFSHVPPAPPVPQILRF